jgi:hypothetical protein
MMSTWAVEWVGLMLMQSSQLSPLLCQYASCLTLISLNDDNDDDDDDDELYFVKLKNIQQSPEASAAAASASDLLLNF